MDNIDKTMKFDYEEIPKDNVETVLNNVHRTLEERGYNAVNQIVGYLLSGDPAYIPRQNDARNQQGRQHRRIRKRNLQNAQKFGRKSRRI